MLNVPPPLRLPILLSVFAIGCQSDEPPNADAPPAMPEEDAGTQHTSQSSNTCDAPALLVEKCGSVTCHGSGTSLPLDLQSPGLEGRLLGARGTNSCASFPLADPNDPEMSLLVSKLSSRTSPCGLTMPLGTTAETELTPAQKECVRDFVMALGSTQP